MQKLTLSQLHDLEWQEAVVVFTEDSWKRQYSLEARSYEISSDNKYFNPNAISSSLFGNCLDGTDNGVRLDLYMHENWKVDYCYIIK
jgi:hypothetical protein